MINKPAIYSFLLTAAVLGISGCAVLPAGKKTTILHTPRKTDYITLPGYELQNGYPLKKGWWIAYSDRDDNYTSVAPGNDMPRKKLAYLDPVFITRQKGNYLKAVQFLPDADPSATKGKIEKKTAKSLGWIRKEKLLLWSSGLTEKHTGFFAKAIICIAGPEIPRHADKFLNNDSLVLFSTPALSTKNNYSLAPGTIVYLYKQSEDRKSYLVSVADCSTPENIRQNVSGWISSDALSIWGCKSACTIPPGTPEPYPLQNGYEASATLTPAILPTDRYNRTTLENIFPIQGRPSKNDTLLQLNYMNNILDYSKNKVYNVLGNPIYYQEYKKIISDGQKANVVFVLDAGSNNRLYFPSVTSVIQDLQMYFDTSALFRAYNFGAVIYKQSKCDQDTLPDIMPLTSNYNDIVHFIGAKQQLAACEDASSYQPLYKGLRDACGLLQPVSNETNIIILIGTTGTLSDEGHSSVNSIIGSISRAHAKLMFFQSVSKPSDAYNDFVLSAEKTVIGSAQSLSEAKKQKIVDLNDIIPDPGYNLVTGDSGVYSLNFPTQSMSQGFVLFPKKGSVMQPGMLKKYFDTLLHQVVYDNQHINTSLRTYFRNIGAKTTSVKPGYISSLDSFATSLPLPFMRAFANEQNIFLTPAHMTAAPFTSAQQLPIYGILLSESEYEQQIQQFNNIYSLTAASEKFRRRKAYKKYKQFVRLYARNNHLRTGIHPKYMTTGQALHLYSGYITTDSFSNNIILRDLKKKKKISRKDALDFYNRFKYAADAMQEQKNTPGVRVPSGNNIYYWFDEKHMPLLLKKVPAALAPVLTKN
ncbi:type VI secretion system protein TssR domain-containing protein [Chitinophagaceae bacterium MMS25-I14]